MVRLDTDWLANELMNFEVFGGGATSSRLRSDESYENCDASKTMKLAIQILTREMVSCGF